MAECPRPMTSRTGGTYAGTASDRGTTKVGSCSAADRGAGECSDDLRTACARGAHDTSGTRSAARHASWRWRMRLDLLVSDLSVSGGRQRVFVEIGGVYVARCLL